MSANHIESGMDGSAPPPVKRRTVVKLALAAASWLLGRARRAAAATTAGQSPSTAPAAPGAGQGSSAGRQPDADYIVVGSGAGGGTVAARLAEAGFSVLVLEAGGDPRTSVGTSPHAPGRNNLPDHYDVPAFHPFATENDGMRWDFFVRHYADDERQKRDPKYRETHAGKRVDGVLYPRAGTLGGCTAHNAMILVYPYDADWNQLADLTGDKSWRAERMRKYFQRIERCAHRPFERFRSRVGANPSRHGWSGWLQTEVAVPSGVFRNRDLRQALVQTWRTVRQDPELGFTEADRRARVDSRADPNDARIVGQNTVGLRVTPVTTRNFQRVGSRERLLEVNRRFPTRLKIELHALATRVLFDGNRAIGVEYQSGERLYGASPDARHHQAPVRQAFAGREVILAGGAFNSPQLLMLSGIGPKAELDRLGIPVKVDLPGVGQSLQDRYEVAVVNRMNFDAWKALEGATFTDDDPQYREWSRRRDGVYKTNGALLSVVARSSPAQPDPDLFLYSVLGRFEGYFPGYSALIPEHLNVLTWVILKARTNNTAGHVTLQSIDPRVPPVVHFKYFDEGNDPSFLDGNSARTAQDLDAVVKGVTIARKLVEGLKKENLLAKEEIPGDAYPDESTLREFVRNHAWGHHASCTCRIGPRADGGVLSSDFRVHGTEGLRVVDASIFPRIPGFFIVSAIYMIGEKAADVIAAAARGKGLRTLFDRLRVDPEPPRRVQGEADSHAHG